MCVCVKREKGIGEVSEIVEGWEYMDMDVWNKGKKRERFREGSKRGRVTTRFG